MERPNVDAQHKAIKIAIAHFQGGDECILSPKRVRIWCIRKRGSSSLFRSRRGHPSAFVPKAGNRVEMQSPAFGRAMCRYE